MGSSAVREYDLDAVGSFADNARTATNTESDAGAYLAWTVAEGGGADGFGGGASGILGGSAGGGGASGILGGILGGSAGSGSGILGGSAGSFEAEENQRSDRSCRRRPRGTTLSD